jgi:O-antigen/teichoic acid export membrane protein
MTVPRYLNGIGWSGLNAGASVLLPLGIFVFFARLLPPALIGVVALGVACTEILKTVGLQGLNETLLQQKDDLERCHQTAAAVLLAAGTGLLVAYVGLIHGLSLLMPEVAPHVLALDMLGLRIVADLATVQPQAALAQRLSYRRLGMRALVGNATAGALGIGVALGDKALAGMIAYQVGQSAMVFLTTSLGTGSFARPRWHKDCFQRMAREASLSSCVRLVAASMNNLDQVVIALLVGSTQLAYYNLGKRIESTFITVSGSFGSILFQPLFAQSTDRQHQLLSRAVTVLTVICGLPAAVFVANGRIAITTVFGQQWAPATMAAVLLTLSGMSRAITTVPGSLLSVSGRNRDLLVVAAGSAAAGILLVASLANFGIESCAGALALKNVLTLGWMARTTRDKVAEPGRTYVLYALVPFLLMLASALVGRWIAGQFVLGNGAVGRFATMGISGLPTAIVTVIYFSALLVRPLPRSLRRRRAANT